MNTLFSRPGLAAIIVWHLLWGLIAVITEARFLIEVFNGLLLAMAFGVTVAYLPAVWQVVKARALGEGQILTLGIWVGWLAIIEQRLLSIVFNSMGQPVWILNTDYTTHYLSMTLFAGLCHLAGPEAIDGVVPKKQWVKIGILAGVGALTAILIMWYNGSLVIGSMFTRYGVD